jgi:hypothetical protein
MRISHLTRPVIRSVSLSAKDARLARSAMRLRKLDSISEVTARRRMLRSLRAPECCSNGRGRTDAGDRSPGEEVTSTGDGFFAVPSRPVITTVRCGISQRPNSRTRGSFDQRPVKGQRQPRPETYPSTFCRFGWLPALQFGLLLFRPQKLRPIRPPTSVRTHTVKPML